MHSTELARLVETAGTDYVGVNLDSGNACWTLEDPIDNLRNLGKYIVTTSLRDSAVWNTDDGAAVAWTAMGEGQVDLEELLRALRRLCPNVPVHIETISGFNREFPYLKPEFWKAWPHMPAESFAHFLALREEGHAAFRPYKRQTARTRPKSRAELSDGRDRAQHSLLQDGASSLKFGVLSPSGVSCSISGHDRRTGVGRFTLPQLREAQLLWSWRIRQPDGVRFQTRENQPERSG